MTALISGFTSFHDVALTLTPILYILPAPEKHTVRHIFAGALCARTCRRGNTYCLFLEHSFFRAVHYPSVSVMVQEVFHGPGHMVYIYRAGQYDDVRLIQSLCQRL